MQLLVRLLAYVAIFCLPFLLLALTSRQRGGLLWLMFPIVWGIPGMLGSLVVLLPAEAYLAARGLGRLSGVLLPALGAVVGALLLLVYLLRSGGPVLGHAASARVNRLRGPRLIVALALAAALGAGWGALWWLSGWAVQHVGLA